MRQWIPLQFKRALKSPAVLALSVLAVLLYAVIALTALHGERETSFGLMAGEGVCADSVREVIAGSGSSICPCVIYTDQNKLRRDVLRGSLDCGFVLTDELDEAALSGREGEGVIYYYTPATREGLILKEKVFSGILRAVSVSTLTGMAQNKSVFPGGNGKLEEGLLTRRQEYLESGALMKAEFLDASGEKIEDASTLIELKSGLYARRLALAVFFIFAAAFAFGRERFTSGYASIKNALTREGRAVYLMTRIFSETALPAAFLFLALMVPALNAGGGSAVQTFLTLAAALVFSSAASAAFSSLFRSEMPYLFAAMSVLAAGYLIF